MEVLLSEMPFKPELIIFLLIIFHFVFDGLFGSISLKFKVTILTYLIKIGQIQLEFIYKEYTILSSDFNNILGSKWFEIGYFN